MKPVKTNISGIYKPKQFFLLTFLFTYAAWFASAYFSFQPNGQTLFVLFMLPGLVAPFAIALYMIYTSGKPKLKRNFVNKLFNFKRIKLSTIPALLLIMPVAVLVSITISTLFAQPFSQFQLAGKFSFSAGFMPVLLVLFLAASFEELGWRSYAMDSLRQKRNYFKATMIFAFLWAFWHLPLFFIKDYYQYDLLHTNIWYAVNFMVSIFPMAVIISWICQKNNGSILAAILFHFIINLSQEAFEITQTTKCIETFVLLSVATFLVVKNKALFFDKPHLNSNEIS